MHKKALNVLLSKIRLRKEKKIKEKKKEVFDQPAHISQVANKGKRGSKKRKIRDRKKK